MASYRSLRTAILALVGLALVAALVAIAASMTRDPDAIDVAPVAGAAAVLASDVVARTNEERARDGAPALARNRALDAAAQAKAEDMAAAGYYAHVSPDGVTPMDWADAAGYAYRILGENLVVNRKDADAVVDAFMGSDAHRANILRREFAEIGIGVATGTYRGAPATFTVQLFAAPAPDVPRPRLPIVPAALALVGDLRMLLSPLLPAPAFPGALPE